MVTHAASAIRQITSPRFYNSERGFVTEFRSKLQMELNGIGLFPNEAIFEAEAQKSLSKGHGLKLRPDLIIHIPIEAGISQNVKDNNFVVFEFKLNGNEHKALTDFAKLDSMFSELAYPLGIFININSYPNCYLSQYGGDYRTRINEISLALVDDNVLIKHAFFDENRLTTVDL